MHNVPLQIFKTTVIGTIGGMLFYLLAVPLPWLLGAFLFIAAASVMTKHAPCVPIYFRNISFLLFGVYFSLYVHGEILFSVLPLLPIYLPLSALVIGVSLLLGYFLSKWLSLRSSSGILGLVPGAQSAVILTSDSLQANTSFIVLLHSMRKIIVLVTLPFVALLFIPDVHSSVDTSSFRNETAGGSYWWYVFPLLAASLALIHRSLLLAAPPAVMVLLVLTGVDPAPFPEFGEILAQLLLGIYLGSKLRLQDLTSAGANSLFFSAAALFIIGLSTAAGLLLSELTSLSSITAVMSLAPGGLLEMGVIASESGGDPSLVVTLQFIRFLFVFYALPPLLIWYFSKGNKRDA